MADPYPVNSPRRVLSLSRKRRDSGSFLDVDDKASGLGLSGQHGPKPAEVYGFVGSITTVVATAIFFIWAYFPEDWLHAIGVFYYPSRYWALVVPTYFAVIVVLALGFYIGLNFVATPHPTSLNVIFGQAKANPNTNSNSKTSRSYTKAEVSLHNKRTDCWIIIKDKVYDVTPYVEEHPGGDAILNHAGDDSTEGFFGPQHGTRVFDIIEDFCVGNLEQ